MEGGVVQFVISFEYGQLSQWGCFANTLLTRASLIFFEKYKLRHLSYSWNQTPNRFIFCSTLERLLGKLAL